MRKTDSEVVEFIDDLLSGYNLTPNRAVFLYEHNNRIYNPDSPLYYMDLFKEDPHSWCIRFLSELVSSTAYIFGVSENEIWECNERVDDFLKKEDNYTFFGAKEQLASRYLGSHFAGSVDEKALIGLIFGDMSLTELVHTGLPSRYDYSTMPARLYDSLKQLNHEVPGVFHDGEKIAVLNVTTEHFISYPRLREYLLAFLKIARRIEDLFYKQLNSPLTPEEEREYNFYVMALDVRPVVMSSMNATTKVVSSLKKIYEEHHFDEITSYLRFDFWKAHLAEPWRCIEFTEDFDLAQQFFNYVPEAKARLRSFSFASQHFICEYNWSDSFNTSSNKELEHESFSIKKTESELENDIEYATRLSRMASPPKLGGIVVKEPPGRLFARANPAIGPTAIVNNFERGQHHE